MSAANRPRQIQLIAGRVIGILIGLALLVYVLYNFDLAEAAHSLRYANYGYLVPVLILLVVNFAIRALRWGFLFDKTPSLNWEKLFTAMMVGYLANNFLPARAGELVRAYVLGQRVPVAKSTIFATVVVERVIDLLITLFLMAFILLFYPLPAWLGKAGLLLAVVSLAALAFLFSLSWWGVGLVRWLFSRLSFIPAGLSKKIETICTDFVAGITSLRNGRKLLLFGASSVIIWFMEVSSIWLTAKTFSLDLSLGGALFVMLAVALGMMVPSSPGAIGTYEFFATNALAIIGVGGASALSFALLMHAVSFLGSNALAALCMMLSGQKVLLSNMHRQEYTREPID